VRYKLCADRSEVINMAERCSRITDPSQCFRCRALAQELLTKAEMTAEERKRVIALLHELRDDKPIDDESRNFLNELAVRYLE
jgi:predicted Fe-S protein YdhL (DUF1289 family)